MIVWIIGIIIWILCLWGNYKLAVKKHRNVAAWIILSVFFSWIVLIFNAILPSKDVY